jgi:hypothetical protein
MATLQNSGKNGGQARHDGQQNFQHSNQRNPDNVRNATRDHEYREYDEELTNDARFENGNAPENADFRDTRENEDKDNS